MPKQHVNYRRIIELMHETQNTCANVTGSDTRTPSPANVQKIIKAMGNISTNLDAMRVNLQYVMEEMKK